VIDRIKANVGVPWMTETVDTIKAAIRRRPSRAVATTMMATYDVLERAAAAHRNLIITHEPTFYGHLDQTTDLENEKDPTFLAKKALIETAPPRRLALPRSLAPAPSGWHPVGMVKALGWESNQRADDPSVFSFEQTTLESAGCRHPPEARRENPASRRRSAAESDHRRALTRIRRLSEQPPTAADADVQVVIIGEAHEWEGIEHGGRRIGRGAAEGADRDRPHSVGTGRHGGMRALAAHVRHGSAEWTSCRQRIRSGNRTSVLIGASLASRTF
jgi:hypothetical protein